MRLKTYSEMMRRQTFEDRYLYLRIGGSIGEATFGSSRHMNQGFYASRLWRETRHRVILRDNGCDLGDPRRQINDRIIIHHINPITEYDIVEQTEFLLDPEFLICVCRETHLAIHFGDITLLPQLPVERSRHDTSPWLLSDSRRHQ
jgi:hypothetical protein